MDTRLWRRYFRAWLVITGLGTLLIGLVWDLRLSASFLIGALISYFAVWAVSFSVSLLVQQALVMAEASRVPPPKSAGRLLRGLLMLARLITVILLLAIVVQWKEISFPALAAGLLVAQVALLTGAWIHIIRDNS